MTDLQIDMQPVDSSNIHAIGHHPESGTMRVQFASGGIYDYPDVTPAQHQALINADSIGSHFHKHFRYRSFAKRG